MCADFSGFDDHFNAAAAAAEPYVARIFAGGLAGSHSFPITRGKLFFFFLMHRLISKYLACCRIIFSFFSGEVRLEFSARTTAM